MSESGERFRKPWPAGQQFNAHMAREVPGEGATARDDGTPGESGVKYKAIPRVSTERLQRHEAALHETVGTPEGLHAWDNTRRSLIEQTMKLKAIRHELKLRGVGE